MASAPASADVLVLGAGPAGSACAQLLAQAGLRVVLADQHVFPRDKVCGDGLIPDAHAALQRLGLLEAVMREARHAASVHCTAPRGGTIDVPGRLAVLPRKRLDHILLQSAQAAGAQALMPARFEAPLVDEAGRVAGARLKLGDGSAHALHARWTVLATGASAGALQAAGVCQRRTPSGIALRGYVRHPQLATRVRQLEVMWHPRLSGGYGWIFPAPDGLFNIGAGLTGSHVGRGKDDGGGAMKDVNLRGMFEAFCEVYPTARALMAGGELVGELKGAPLRCSLRGAAWSRPGMLVTGEAAGSTYAFTGEGIGKALETGMLAAQAILGGRPAAEPGAVAGEAPGAAPRLPGVDAATDAAVRGAYAATLQALSPKFELYDRASHVNHRPWIADLVFWRARRSPHILRRMAGVLEETQNPGRLFSWRGLTRLMVE